MTLEEAVETEDAEEGQRSLDKAVRDRRRTWKSGESGRKLEKDRGGRKTEDVGEVCRSMRRLEKDRRLEDT